MTLGQHDHGAGEMNSLLGSLLQAVEPDSRQWRMLLHAAVPVDRIGIPHN